MKKSQGKMWRGVIVKIHKIGRKICAFWPWPTAVMSIGNVYEEDVVESDGKDDEDGDHYHGDESDGEEEEGDLAQQSSNGRG